MNRNEEYHALLRELERTPEELEHTAERALNRKTASQKRRRAWGISCGSLAACFAGFVLLVNLSMPFARACGSVPVLRELAKAVSWSPSLSAAVENDYVQPIGQKQEENGITATVEYVIVDRKKLSIFYSLDFDAAQWERLEVDYDFGDIHGWAGSAGAVMQEPGELLEIYCDFMDQDVPGTMDLTLKVSGVPKSGAGGPASPGANVEDSYFSEPVREEPDYLAEFSFSLEFDPYFTAQGQVIPVNADFVLDGQRFTLTEVELYPTHLRVNLADDPENTAWLKSLDLYLENEHGERFENRLNGISASGDPDGEGYATFWLDSPFFSRGEHLTLHVTRAKWREKDAPKVRLDLAAGTAEHLPEGVRFLSAEKHAQGWVVSFAAPREPGGGMYGLFSGGFWDEAGNHHDIMRFGSTFGVRDPETGKTMEEDTMFTEDFPLVGLEGNIAYLEPDFNRETRFDTPVAVPIK